MNTSAFLISLAFLWFVKIMYSLIGAIFVAFSLRGKWDTKTFVIVFLSYIGILTVIMEAVFLQSKN